MPPRNWGRIPDLRTRNPGNSPTIRHDPGYLHIGSPGQLEWVGHVWRFIAWD